MSAWKPRGGFTVVEAFKLLGNLEDIIKVKEDIKIGKGFDPAKNCVSEQNGLRKKHYFP